MRRMYTIGKEFMFAASHRLEGLPPDHPCTRTHGHTYLVTAIFEGGVLNGEAGMLLDYREMGVIKDWLDETVDHQDLNAVLTFNPTAEHLARYFFETFSQMVPHLAAVRVQESPKTFAEYRR